MSKQIVLCEAMPRAPTPEQLNKLERIAKMYGVDALPRIHVLPNFSPNNGQAVPSGVAFEFASASAPMFAAPFNPTQLMTGGMAIFEVTTPLKATHEFSAKQQAAALSSVVNIQNPLSNELRDSTKQRADAPGSKYNPTLQSGAGWIAGVFHSTSVKDNRRTQKAYVAVVASLPEVSRALFRKIEQRQQTLAAEKDYGAAVHVGPRRVETTLTVGEFLNWPETQYALDAGRRNRAAVALEVARSLGLQLDTVEDRMSGTGQPIAVALADVPTYELKKLGERAVYYADAYDAAARRGVMPLLLAPTAGIALLHGKTHASHLIGIGWENDHCNAFPASTGQTMSADEAYAKAANQCEFVSGSPAHPFKWSGQLNFNHATVPEAYQTRSQAFRAAEHALGRSPALTEEDLAPVFVMLEPTPLSKAGAHGAVAK